MAKMGRQRCAWFSLKRGGVRHPAFLDQLPDDLNTAGFDKPSQFFKWIFLVALLGIFENHCRQNGLLILDF